MTTNLLDNSCKHRTICWVSQRLLSNLELGLDAERGMTSYGAVHIVQWRRRRCVLHLICTIFTAFYMFLRVLQTATTAFLMFLHVFRCNLKTKIHRKPFKKYYNMAVNLVVHTSHLVTIIDEVLITCSPTNDQMAAVIWFNTVLKYDSN